jgi:hypothetical protein
MNAKHRSAVELLLSHPETTVARRLGVQLETLRAWMQTDEFAEALRAREREQQAAAKRIARQAVLKSAAKLCQLASNPKKTDTKVLIDVLKASGAFEAETDDAGAGLAQIIKLAEQEADANASSE